jgi:hypothetical protein
MVNERLRTAVRPRWGDVSTPLRRFPPATRYGRNDGPLHLDPKIWSDAAVRLSHRPALSTSRRTDTPPCPPNVPLRGTAPTPLVGSPAGFLSPPAPPSAPLAALASTRAEPCGAPFD